MRRSTSFFAFALAAFLGACTPAARVPPDVSIVFNAEPGKLPFDPHSVRLRGAMDQLARAAGRAMTLDLDVALLREFQSWFETGIVTAVENAAHDLGDLQRTRPELWAELGGKLATLTFRYDPKAPKVTVKIQDDQEVVLVTVPAKATTFLPHEAALLSLEAQYDAKLPEKYAAGVPASVSVAEKRAYFRALTGQKPPPRKPDDPASTPGVANELRSTSILRAIKFFDVAMPLELRAELHEWLLGEGTYFRDAYLVNVDAVKASPPTSHFHRAEAAWVDWVQQNTHRFTDGERASLARLIFVKSPVKRQKSGPPASVGIAFPGFDRTGFGLHVLEEWAAAGHPRVVPGRDRLIELFDLVVCPFEIDSRGDRVQPDSCDHDFYAAVAEKEEAQKRLLDFLLVQKDPVLIETVFANFMRIRALHAASYLWRGLEAEEALWKGATFALAEELGNVAAGKLNDEALRLWQTYPARRGVLLYLLSQIDRYGNDRVAWGSFGDGASRASAADFAAFLAFGRRAYATAWVVWPLLGRGWSRAAALVPGLDRFVDDPQTPFFHPQDPELALSQIVSRTCAEKNFADLAKLHAYFVDRVKKMPNDEARFADALKATTKGNCRPNARPVPRAVPLELSAGAPRASASGTGPQDQ
jgi:hypothetical protein